MRSRRALVSFAFAAAACNQAPVESLEKLTVFNPSDAGARRDVGVRPDATAPVDGGVRDAEPGRDRMVGRDREPPGDCEGCECTSTAIAVSFPFTQETCQPGLLCVHWDLMSGLTIGAELEGPVKSCLRPCESDRHCGAGQRCASLGLSRETGAGRVCVDDVAGFDEYCSGSRSNVERMSDPAIVDGISSITACETGLTCQFFQFPNAFNPDESLCAALCETDADCAGVPGLPYCNPRAIEAPSPNGAPRGICSDGKHPNGALCGSNDPDKIFRLATGCDTSVETCGMNREACPFCVSINLDANQSLTPEGMGICMSMCNDSNPCAGGRSCIPQIFSTGDGACSDDCRVMPDTCPGVGSLGNGQDCLDLNIDASFCIDRVAPSLIPATWDSAGMILTAGDDCTGDLENYSYFRCPDGSTCTPTQEQGFCIYGCTFADPTSGDALCKTLLNSTSAVCTEPQTGFAVCGD